MPVITKETAMMSFLYNILYETESEKDFIERLKEELSEGDMKNILNSANEETKKIFTEPFLIDKIKVAIKKADGIFEKAIEESKHQLMKALEKFDNSDFSRIIFQQKIKCLN